MPRMPIKTKPRLSGSLERPSNAFTETRAQLQQAERLRSAGQLDQARAICTKLTTQYPDYMGALYTLGLIYADMRNYTQALGCLVRAAMLNPRHWKTFSALSGVYLALDAPEMAAEALNQAAKMKPDDAGIFATLGEIYRTQREYELAAETFRKSLSLDHTLWAVEMGLANSCAHLGEFATAAAAVENVIRHRPRSIKPFHLLTSLPSVFVKCNILPLIDRTVRGENEDTLEFESAVYFTRAAALHNAGRHEDAWREFLVANRMMFAANKDACSRTLRVQKEILEGVCKTAAKIRVGAPGEEKHAVSLFILGPSRSGKTTMEQLLGSISGVKRGYENPIADNAVRRTFQTAGMLTSSFYGHLPPALEPLCREVYLEELDRRAGSARVFTNTHPAQIVDAIRIAAIYPNVRLILVKRNLDDIALRIFMKNYAQGFSYAYNMDTIREYINWYYRMIDVLAEKLPQITLVVQYENMIARPAEFRAAAAGLCGLELPEGPLPEIGDDRGCAVPYSKYLNSPEINVSGQE